MKLIRSVGLETYAAEMHTGVLSRARPCPVAKSFVVVCDRG